MRHPQSRRRALVKENIEALALARSLAFQCRLLAGLVDSDFTSP
jgi:hypothetical protein